MRAETTRAKLERFLTVLGERVRGPGVVYLTGGATALLHRWRDMTVDVDLKADPEPAGFFEALAALKDELDINVELASPDQFIPPLPGWRERSRYIAVHGPVQFFHYDLYSQALSKLQRRHERDLRDVRAMVRDGMILRDRLWELFLEIEPSLIRYPGVDAGTFRAAVEEFCREGQ